VRWVRVISFSLAGGADNSLHVLFPRVGEAASCSLSAPDYSSFTPHGAQDGGRASCPRSLPPQFKLLDHVITAAPEPAAMGESRHPIPSIVLFGPEKGQMDHFILKQKSGS